MPEANNIHNLLDLTLHNAETYIHALSETAIYLEVGALAYYLPQKQIEKIATETKKTKENFKSVNDLNSVKMLIQLDQLIYQTYRPSTLILPAYDHFIEPKILAQAKIEIQLDVLEKKAQNLKKRNFLPASLTLQQIITDLRTLNEQYFTKGEINGNEYSVSALEIIDKNKSILEEHRNANYIIANIVLVILTIGVAPLIHKIKFGNFLFFNMTDSSKKIEPLKQLIIKQDEVSPNLGKLACT